MTDTGSSVVCKTQNKEELDFFAGRGLGGELWLNLHIKYLKAFLLSSYIFIV